jgi:two-component system OmpR family response regulator
MTYVLVVEDEPAISSMLTMAMRFLGFTVSEAATGEEAFDVINERSPDVILLDVVLPDRDGFEVCRTLRTAGFRMPVLFLTARDSVEDKVRALEIGGDDYVTKPFDLNEVAARIRALLRRSRESRDWTAGSLRAGWVELNRDTHEVTRRGQPVRLSATEFTLLRFLLENSGRVISKAAILDSVWNYNFQGESGVVETYIYNLRRKLGDANQSLISTVRGVGYLVHESPVDSDIGR